MSFATGSVSPRKEPRGRKRRSKLSQILLGDVPHAASSSTVAGLGSPRPPPLSAHLHMQLQTKPEAVFLCPSSKVPAGGQAAPATSIAGPLLQESPLGLTLKKTPSLLDLISSTLGSRPFEGWRGHGDAPQEMLGAPSRPPRHMPTFTGVSSGPSIFAPAGAAAPSDKLKASNFAALSAKIGTWERHSRYEGDLVAKCYFAKKKLVWEVLEQGLKSKVEVQWSDIKRIKAVCSDTEPNVLEIDIAKAPMFFHEMSPQPRKHTIWSNAPDFTGGQATIARKHVLTFAPGVLEPHYKKLLLCDSRLRAIAAGLPEPVAMRPPPHHRLQVPRPVGSVPCMPIPRYFSELPGVPSGAGSSGTLPWSGLVDNMQRVLLQERPGSPSSVIGRGDRPFGEESGSSDDTGQLLPPAGLGFVDANFARGVEGHDQDEMMLDSPFPPAEGPFPPLDFARSPPAGLFPDMPYDLPNPELLMDAEMEAAGEAPEGVHSEVGEQGRQKGAADQLSSSQPRGSSVFLDGGRLRKYGFSSSVPSLGSEMSAFHVVCAGPKALRSGPGRSPRGPSTLDDLDNQMCGRDFLPAFRVPVVHPASGGEVASAGAWRPKQEPVPY